MLKNVLRGRLSVVSGLAIVCVFLTLAPSLMAGATPGIAVGDATITATGLDTVEAPEANQTQAPSGAAAPPSLDDLGISPDQAKGSAADQARLDKRSHMLKIHQRLGLITLAPLLATLITSNNAASRGGNGATGATTTTSGTTSGRELHAALGITTASLYLTTAYFAIRAPKIAGTKTRGPIVLHKALACIHGPGMLLTPILGAMAYNQRNSGQKVHGIASAHSAVAAVTGVAYGAAMLSVMIKL